MSRKTTARDQGIQPNGLTPIHQRIHCAATPDTESADKEQERIDVDNFLSTLARIALAVAARQATKDGGGLA